MMNLTATCGNLSKRRGFFAESLDRNAAHRKGPPGPPRLDGRSRRCSLAREETFAGRFRRAPPTVASDDFVGTSCLFPHLACVPKFDRRSLLFSRSYPWVRGRCFCPMATELAVGRSVRNLRRTSFGVILRSAHQLTALKN
ncbi:hypothetical protein ACHAWF_000988 [Thalassiosira exigua]